MNDDLKEKLKNMLNSIIELNKNTSFFTLHLSNMTYEELVNRIPNMKDGHLLRLFELLLNYSTNSLQNLNPNKPSIVNQIIVSDNQNVLENKHLNISHQELRELGKLYNENLE